MTKTAKTFAAFTMAALVTGGSFFSQNNDSTVKSSDSKMNIHANSDTEENLKIDDKVKNSTKIEK